MSRPGTEHATAGRTPLALPPAWTWTTVALAVAAFLPMAAAAGRWRWTPSTGPLMLSLLTATVILEAWISSDHRQRRVPEERSRYHRVVELLLLGLLVVAVTVSGRPITDLRPDRLLGPELVTIAALTVGVWLAIVTTHRDLVVLRARGRTERGRHDPLENLTRRALLVGLVVATASALADVPFAAGAIVAYIAIATVALTRARFADLELRWSQRHTEVRENVASRYRALVGGLVAAVTLVALLLPRPVGRGPTAALAVVRRMGEWLEERFRWLYEDFLEMPEPEEDDTGPVDAVGDLEDEWGTPEPAGAPFDLPEPLTWMDPYWAAFAWTLAGAVAVTIVVLYLRQRLDVRGALRPPAFAGRLRHPVALLRASARRALAWLKRLAALLPFPLLRGKERGCSVREPEDRSGAPGGQRAQKVSSEHPPERLRVLRAYEDLLGEADAHGRGRRPSHTPYEFEEWVAPVLSGQHEDMRRLTESFVVARYSVAEITSHEAEEAVAASRTVRAGLRSAEEPS